MVNSWSFYLIQLFFLRYTLQAYIDILFVFTTKEQYCLRI